jgi:hypothetical protein
LTLSTRQQSPHAFLVDSINAEGGASDNSTIQKLRIVYDGWLKLRTELLRQQIETLVEFQVDEERPRGRQGAVGVGIVAGGGGIACRPIQTPLDMA